MTCQGDRNGMLWLSPGYSGLSYGVMLGICLVLLELRLGVKPWATWSPVLKPGPLPRLHVPQECRRWGPVQRGRHGHSQPLLVPDGSVHRGVGRGPGTDQSHVHEKHFLGEHITQQRDLAS